MKLSFIKIIGILLLLAIPVIVWAIQTNRFELRKRAVSTCIPVGSTITVTPDSGPGTCHDLQTAIDAVTGPGFDIYVRAGDYHVPNISGSSFSLRIFNKSQLNIHGENAVGTGYANLFFDNNNSGGVRIQDSNSVRFEWFHLNGTTANGMFSINNSSQTSVGYINMHDSSAHTFDMQGGTNNHLFNCDIQSSAGAVEISQQESFRVSNCVIHNANNGITVNNSTGEIFSNTIHTLSENGIRAMGSTVSIRDNTITKTGSASTTASAAIYSGYGTASPSSSLTIRNNILALNYGGGIKIDSAHSVNTAIDHTDVYGNYTNFIGLTNPTGSNFNISADPLFGQDYCIAPNSPTIYGNIANHEYMGSKGICPAVTNTPTPTPNPARFSCATDADCGCGLDSATRNCAIQNNQFLNGRCNAPDFCSGISGRCGPKCVSGRCQLICPNTSPTATPSPTPTQAPNLNPPVCVPSSIPPATGVAPLTVTLHGGGNAGAGTGLDGYRWDYDNNGTWDSGVSINPMTHIYVTPGTYNPKYQIRGTNGIWSSVCSYPYTVVAQTPGTHDHSLDIIVRFAGVRDGRASGAKATIRFINGTLDLVTSPRTFTHTTNGNYKTTLTLSPTQLPPGSGYVVIVKGEKHLARKYCKASGQTTVCQSQETITLPVPTGQTTTFTFTGLPLDPGDLRAQDGRADLSDFAKIKDRMNISCSLLTDVDKLIADVNYSGCVDSLDAYWMRHTLETRYDEN